VSRLRLPPKEDSIWWQRCDSSVGLQLWGRQLVLWFLPPMERQYLLLTCLDQPITSLQRLQVIWWRRAPPLQSHVFFSHCGDGQRCFLISQNLTTCIQFEQNPLPEEIHSSNNTAVAPSTTSGFCKKVSAKNAVAVSSTTVRRRQSEQNNCITS